MNIILGLDIGGTHIAGALVDAEEGDLKAGSYYKKAVHSCAGRDTILNEWCDTIRLILKDTELEMLSGIGIAMPGPFDYEKGISLIRGLEKYEALYGFKVGEALKKKLQLPRDYPLYFKNDAACFALGENWKGAAEPYRNVLAITLGTGLGAAFIKDGVHIQMGNTVPEGGTLYQVPYKDGKAEDYFSARGLLKKCVASKGEQLEGVKVIYEKALQGEEDAIGIFKDFGRELAAFLTPCLRDFKADCLVLGGGISKASRFFIGEMKKEFIKNNLFVKVMTSKLGDKAAILGAARLLENGNKESITNTFRKTNQFLLPLKKEVESQLRYDVYPSFHLEEGNIHEGIHSLAAYIVKQKTVCIDGYAGVFWSKLKSELQRVLPQNLKINIQDTNDWFLPEARIKELIGPYLGAEDSVWGTRCDKALVDLFDKEKIMQCLPDADYDVNILMGTGSALSSWDAPVIYFDLPKNELQYRMRAGSITNLGSNKIEGAVQMYKRFYFVDWVLLNKHKKDILNSIKVVVDSQRPDAITWMYSNDLKRALQTMSENVFRVRPWFEPGAWGGQWMKKNIEGINREEVNYAWSFELITPENGLLFESGHLLLEVSFDLLMFTHNKEILGQGNVKKFEYEFPIRFDFLDTVQGGNLSIQCHPSLEYIKNNFGEKMTQDETYYILDAEKGAGVYLGFQEDIDPAAFREELESSTISKQPVEVSDYVQYLSAKKHDFFLIPNGTIHSAAGGNLVLEISATPYIFTFKMYDWLRLDLNGNPRPINIEHAFNNLNFDRKGSRVRDELISKPSVLTSGEDWKLIHLPTHPEHFYDVHRLEFKSNVKVNTEGSCQILMLVEGESVLVETKNGFKQRFHYAETFVIPAAAGSYTLINEGTNEAKVVKAFLKS